MCLYGSLGEVWVRSPLYGDTHCIEFDVVDGEIDCSSVVMSKLDR